MVGLTSSTEVASLYSSTKVSDFNDQLEGFQGFNILPIAKAVAAQTIGLNLVSVTPMPSPGMPKEKMDRINRDVLLENRDRKIDSLQSGEDFIEMKPEDHPDWMNNAIYFDYLYESVDQEDDIIFGTSSSN